MPLIRHKQRAVTSLNPVAGQAPWINPSKLIGLIPPFFRFAADSSAVSDAIMLFDTTDFWELHFRMVADVYAGGTNDVLCELASNGVRARNNGTARPDIRANTGSTATAGVLVQLVDAEPYQVIHKSDNLGNVTTTLTNLRSDTQQQDLATPATGLAVRTELFHISNDTAGLNDFVGGIANVEWYEGSPSVRIYNYEMREGGGTTFTDSEGNGPDITLTPGSGAWVTR